MEINEGFENIIKYLGSNSFAIYCYIKEKSDGSYTRFSLLDVQKQLTISRPTIIQCIKNLKLYGIISTKIEIEIGKKRLLMRTYNRCKYQQTSQNFLTSQNILPAKCPEFKNNITDVNNRKYNGKCSACSQFGKKFLPACPYNNNINTNTNININKSKMNINRSKSNKDSSKEIYFNILKKVLSFKRYDNEYYKGKKWSFREKEKAHIENLIKNVEDIDAYIEWWIKNKASRMPGLSIGLIACTPMIEEYQLKHQKEIKINRKVIGTPEKKKINDMKVKMAKEVIEEYNSRKELKSIDKQFLDDMIKEGIIIKNKNKMELANGIGE